MDPGARDNLARGIAERLVGMEKIRRLTLMNADSKGWVILKNAQLTLDPKFHSESNAPVRSESSSKSAEICGRIQTSGF
jgi:hypothetical protein